MRCQDRRRVFQPCHLCGHPALRRWCQRCQDQVWAALRLRRTRQAVAR